MSVAGVAAAAAPQRQGFSNRFVGGIMDAETDARDAARTRYGDDLVALMRESQPRL